MSSTFFKIKRNFLLSAHRKEVLSMPEFQPNKSLYVYSTYGATYPMHFHSHCEIMYITSGDVKTEVDGREYIAHTGEVIFVAPHQIHSFVCRQDISIFIMFAGFPMYDSFAERMNNNLPASPIVRFFSEAERNLFLDILKYLSSQFRSKDGYEKDTDSVESPMVASAMGRAAFALLMEHLTWKKSLASDQECMRRILEYCMEHYKTDISLHSVAEAMELSDHTVSRIFTTAFHCNFRQYINSLRIDEAAGKLLSSDMPITQAALTSGFDTLRTFNRAFLAKKGITPSEYRLRNLQIRDLSKNS